jgi:hypothetical protein
MNIFYVDENPIQSARDLCNKHICSQILESAQMLCTVHHQNPEWLVYIPFPEEMMKATHRYHPCTVWVGKSVQNYGWLCRHGLELCNEYTRRYEKEHQKHRLMKWLSSHYPDLSEFDFYPPPQVMPDQYKQEDTVAAYRSYYRGEKSRFATWKTQPPEWW